MDIDILYTVYMVEFCLFKSKIQYTCLGFIFLNPKKTALPDIITDICSLFHIFTNSSPVYHSLKTCKPLINFPYIPIKKKYSNCRLIITLPKPESDRFIDFNNYSLLISICNSLSCSSSTLSGASVIRQDASFTLGKAITSLIESAPTISITTLSSP